MSGILEVIHERAKKITLALGAAGIDLDLKTAGALLYMSVHLTHMLGGRQAEFALSVRELWDLIREFEGAHGR